MKIDDREINTPPYNVILKLWEKAEKLNIPDYKRMTEEELINAIKKTGS